MPLPDAVLRVLADATGAWVLHASGLSRIEGGAVVGTSAFMYPPATPGGLPSPMTATAALQPVLRPDGRYAGQPLLKSGKYLHTLDGINTQIGIQTHIQLKHLHGITGLLADHGQEGGK